MRALIEELKVEERAAVKEEVKVEAVEGVVVGVGAGISVGAGVVVVAHELLLQVWPERQSVSELQAEGAEFVEASVGVEVGVSVGACPPKF